MEDLYHAERTVIELHHFTLLRGGVGGGGGSRPMGGTISPAYTLGVNVAPHTTTLLLTCRGKSDLDLELGGKAYVLFAAAPSTSSLDYIR